MGRRRRRRRGKPITGATVSRSAYRRTTEERNAHELEIREMHNGTLPGTPIEIEEVGDVVDEDAAEENERAEGREEVSNSE